MVVGRPSAAYDVAVSAACQNLFPTGADDTAAAFCEDAAPSAFHEGSAPAAAAASTTAQHVCTAAAKVEAAAATFFSFSFPSAAPAAFVSISFCDLFALSGVCHRRALCVATSPKSTTSCHSGICGRPFLCIAQRMSL